MSDVDEATLAGRVLTMRIITIAMLNGILMFVGIAVYVRSTGDVAPPPDVPMLTYIALLVALPMVLAALVVPRIVAGAAVKKVASSRNPDETNSLLGIFQQGLIIRAALFEGPAFFSLIAYFIEGQWPMLVVAGVMAFGIATGFPSVSGVQAWLEERREQIAVDRTAA